LQLPAAVFSEITLLMQRAEPSGPCLELSNGARKPVSTNCSIGRSDSNQIVLAESKVSRRHALVHAQGENEFWLVDLGSSNGTYLNGRRLSQPTRLQNRDRITIGESTLTFRQAGFDSAHTRTLTELTAHDIKSVHCWLLLADIIGSTQLTGNMPAEKLSIVTGTWLANCQEVVEKNGGNINKFLGDGFFAYWPQGENDKAIVAQAVKGLQAIQTQRTLPFRIVLHYGEVIAGGMASLGEESLMGKEVNFIFRMEKLAATLQQSCLASAPACQRMTGVLTFASQGRHRMAGFSDESEFFGF
jgi:adenylate cyclase